MYEKHYFQLETFTNVEGQPSFLLVESEDGVSNAPVKLPPYLKVDREVTPDPFYSTKNIAQ